MISSYGTFNATLSVVPVVVFVALIEAGRMSQFAFPVPFLALFAATAFAGGFGGIKTGTIAGILSASFVIYVYSIGFGPKTLTGALPQALIVQPFTSSRVFCWDVQKMNEIRACPTRPSHWSNKKTI